MIFRQGQHQEHDHSGPPQRIRLSRARGFDLQAASRAVNGRPAVKVDRSTEWGNPFVVGRDGTAADCVRLYQALAAGLIALTTKATPKAQKSARAAMERAATELFGRNLACWCPVDKPCHADVLLAIANAEPEASP